MRNYRHHKEAALRATERRKREDESSRLKNEVVRLTNLRLELTEHQGDGAILAARHTRLVQVAHAPALFEIPCTDPNCQEGGHDLTWEVMRALKSSQSRFEGESACGGRLGSGVCRRMLRYVALAEYD